MKPWLKHTEAGKSVVVDSSRRSFLKAASLTSGGLMMGITLPGFAASGAASAQEYSPNAYLKIAANGDTTIYVGRCEMGQGISTALGSVVAEELEADWSRVTVLQADGDEDKYGSQATGGSASMRVMYTRMREAGAAAKEMLVLAAAKAWQVSVDDCVAENHYVLNKATKAKLGFGELTKVAATLPVPEKPQLKEKADFRYIGSDLKRHDVDLVIRGQRVYGADASVPGMKYAAIVHCPVLGGKLKSLDDSGAKAMKGVSHVVTIDRYDVPYGSVGGVAVVADNTWTAQQAVKQLKIEWDLGPNKDYDTDKYRQQLVANVEKPAKVMAERGDLDAALAAANKTVSATYTGGHLCHAPIEPNASLVWVKPDQIEVWASTQSPADIQKVLADYFKRDKKDVIVHVMISGGAFGRKFKCDYVHEAAVLSAQTGLPIQLTWSREEDMRTGYYHSISAQHIEAAMDESGQVTGWLHRAAFPSIATLFDPSHPYAPKGHVKDIAEHPFGIVNFRSESGEAPAHTRIGWYRAVYAIFYGFAFGSFADELAHAAGKDTVTFLNQVYDNNGNPKQAEQVARSKAALALAAEKSGFGRQLPAGEGMGIAVHYSFQSYVAMAVHVKVDGSDIEVLSVDCAVDCGQVVNKDGATAQMEGAVVMGMGLALHTEIHFKDGAVTNSNYHDYPVMRIPDMPQVRVHFIDSDHEPTGLGEPGVGPFAPALANAIFAATGKRYRDLPLKPRMT
ncbi:xanthine dehydrogenase family protein molybdopterin-binding subunit [Neiella sp. HB171785]|uniref:Xanthine dehydrogenase family protein molybdopterin-binding subunit n=1 Tax=Neiella litorisoli TaxID=2771431 RepID=A0A8J6QNT8_9GAMM|nr:molybdopterin cofactor-binding domain-containing protein [Neiella litorisoli]MBD1388069.1 xanthine dehydrogenase family protein molybdopterin-binding subunit [Neiella litorisoli]